MKLYCNNQTLLELYEVKTSAEQVMIECGQTIVGCYGKAVTLIPIENPYLDVVNKCN